MYNDFRHKDAYSRVSTCFEVAICIEKPEKYRTPDIDQTSSELFQAKCNVLRSEVHKLSDSIWNKEELPQQWKESITVPIYKKGDKTDCSKYRGISLLPVSSHLISRLTPYIEEIIWDHNY
jgi:hypothetical protein